MLSERPLRMSDIPDLRREPVRKGSPRVCSLHPLPEPPLTTVETAVRGRRPVPDPSPESATGPGEIASGGPATASPSGRSSAPPFVPRAVLAGLVPLLVTAVAGLPYYALPLGERLRSPWHPWMRPSGWIGQSAGLLAFTLFVFLWLYPIRKRLRGATFLGPVPRWLDAHIVAGVLMPVAGAVHAGFRFTGLIGWGYFAMLVVATSGVVGRYLYVRVPRGRAGLELSREQVAAERREILGALVESTGLEPRRLLDLLRPVPAGEGGGVVAMLLRMIRDDLDRRRAIRRLARAWDAAGTRPDRVKLRRVATLARREMALAQQIRLLDGTNRLLRLWHAFHLPFAITAFIAVTIHVLVAILFGATWFR